MIIIIIVFFGKIDIHLQGGDKLVSAPERIFQQNTKNILGLFAAFKNVINVF